MTVNFIGLKVAARMYDHELYRAEVAARMYDHELYRAEGRSAHV